MPTKQTENTSALEAQKKYKEQKKIEKLASDLERKKNARLESERRKYDKLIEYHKSNIQNRYEKKLDKRLKKIASQYERKRIDGKHKLQGKEVKPKKVSVKKIKQRAFEEVCRYSKLKRADQFGIVYQVDTGKRVHRSDCVGGHIRSKKNYPHMAFLVSNIWPISNYGNKKQMENTADWISLTGMPQSEIDSLRNFSLNEFAKNNLRDSQYYQDMFELYRDLNKKEMERLGNYYEKKKIIIHLQN